METPGPLSICLTNMVIVFGVLILFLLFKPDGLFKSTIGVKV